MSFQCGNVSGLGVVRRVQYLFKEGRGQLSRRIFGDRRAVLRSPMDAGTATSDTEAHYVKKTNRSFTVEYKNGRRRAERKPNSIWGDLDLKSVARQANEAAFSLPGEHGDAAQGFQPRGQDSSTEPMLTPAMPQPKNSSATEEIPMLDENETVTETNTPTSAEVVPPASVKQRKPRTKKVAAQVDPSQVAGAASDIIDATAGKPRRGRKAKTIPAASLAKSKPLNHVRKTTDAAPTTPVDAIDDMAELLRLEDENRSLRKQLSEKLRAENADLRKRLNLA
ncbi:transcriptional regulator [Rhizobium sp. PDO1-076]|uniref:transcriptional regulator n=1 Tax=Rhizobium sp. PDO1-076 TaxID=1125979 RepID=UPI001FCB47AE|nr:transcriptional regulator [Rhizobium sp. PDO1-076]